MTTSPRSAERSQPDEPLLAPEVQGAFAELGRLLLDQPLGQYLHRVAELAAGALPGVEALSITLVEDGRARSAAFTAPVAAQLDERQYESGFGPCLDAASSGETIVVDVAAGELLYPAFTRTAARLGVRAAASVGMPVPHRVVGAINLYSLSGGIDDDTLALARSFASYAAVALANASLYGSSVRLADQLQEAMRSRAVIEQAKGVLMAVHQVDADEAFARLSRASQDANRKLRDMAGELVARAQEGRGA